MSALEHLTSDTIDNSSREDTVGAGKSPRSRKPDMLLQRARRGAKILATYATGNRACFVRGLIYAILFVAIRVAMPWPLKALIKPWMAEGQVSGTGIWGLNPALVVGVIYAVLVTVLGFADYRLRLNFARFSIGLVKDLREVLINGVRRIQRGDADRGAGDLVTRLIGDTARLKAGLKGFLVHVATNGLLFVGISGVLIWIEWRIGLIFLGASLLTVLVTVVGASRIFNRAIKVRHKESKIADTIAERLSLHADDADEDEDGLDEKSLAANRSSGTHEASITRIQGLTTWTAHLILALAVPAALWQAYRTVTAGTMEPSELFIVMLYALMMLGPMVRLTRQGARTGKILANLDRLGDLLEATTAGPESSRPLCSELRDGISMEEVRLRSRINRQKKRWFGPVSLLINAGEKIAVIGEPGVGKSTLLSILAGRQSYKGSARWDGTEIRDADLDSLGEQIAYVSQNPNWPAFDLSEVVREAEKIETKNAVSRLLKIGRFRQLSARLKNPEGGKILPDQVSHSERKVVALLRYCLSGHSLKVIDDPVSEIHSKKSAKKFLSVLLDAQSEDQTIIVALDRPVGLKRFDRILVMKKKGRIAFDGSPEAWQEKTLKETNLDN